MEKKPKTGDKIRCSECGFEVEVKTPCNCKGHVPEMRCCGKEMQVMLVK